MGCHRLYERSGGRWGWEQVGKHEKKGVSEGEDTQGGYGVGLAQGIDRGWAGYREASKGVKERE